MALVKPFKGLRPQPEIAHEVASLPYDVLSASEAREIAKKNPNTFLRVNKPELEFDDNTDQYSDQIYKKGKENLDRMIADNIITRDTSDSFYLYRLTWQGQSQTGLVALTSVEEYEAGKIKKHEHTRPEKVNDRANHIIALNAQVGPVFSTFITTNQIQNIFNELTKEKPAVSFTCDDSVKHELWVINDSSKIDSIVSSFGALDAFYIADGHHRSEAASEVCRRKKEENQNHTGNEPYNFFLNVLFASDELRILPYNRVVTDLNGLSNDQFITKVSDALSMEKADRAISPNKFHDFGMYFNGAWYQLQSKPGSFDDSHPTESIDADILAKNLISPILGIDNPRVDKRIDFVGGIRGVGELEKLVNSGKYQVAFSMYPTSIDQLLAVADAGKVMPPKSTWFEPKLRSGMVVNLLTE